MYGNIVQEWIWTTKFDTATQPFLKFDTATWTFLEDRVRRSQCDLDSCRLTAYISLDIEDI